MHRLKGLHVCGKVERACIQSADAIEVSPLCIRTLHTGHTWCIVSVLNRPDSEHTMYQPPGVHYARYVSRPVQPDVSSDDPQVWFQLPMDIMSEREGSSVFECGRSMPRKLMYTSPDIPAYALACMLSGRMDDKVVSAEVRLDMVEFEFQKDRWEVVVSLCESGTVKSTRLRLFSMNLWARHTDATERLYLSVEMMKKFVDQVHVLRRNLQIDQRTPFRIERHAYTRSRTVVDEFHVRVTEEGQREPMLHGVEFVAGSRSGKE